MLVQTKGRDIAILRTMGATRGMIMRMFFLNGASIGVLGTLVGLLLGVVRRQSYRAIAQDRADDHADRSFRAEVYFLTQMPSVIGSGTKWCSRAMALGFPCHALSVLAGRTARSGAQA